MTSDHIADWAAARSDKWRRQLAGLEAMLAPIDEPLFRALGLTAPCRIADVGCGGGATTLEVARRSPVGAIAHGYDLSPALIEVARRRSASEPAVVFEVADMAAAAPSAGPYDRLISRLGIMFFTDPASAFANLHRWLVPNGRFAFAVWGPLADNEWMRMTREAVAEVIDLEPLDASAPGPFRYGDVAVLLSDLTRAGFVELEVEDWRAELTIGARLGASDAAQFALSSFSSFAELLSAAGNDAVHAARRALTNRLGPHERDGVVALAARVHIITGGTGG